MSDRKSITAISELITDPDELARKEVENGLKQFQFAMDIVKDFVLNDEKTFKLRPHYILQLHSAALNEIHPQSGTFRNSSVKISNSVHQPPECYFVSEFITDMCEYVNIRWNNAEVSKIHLAAYIMWKLNWIHPFADGNGRTSRAVSYMILCIGMNSVLPGVPSIPDQISSDKTPYYSALETADKTFKENDIADLSDMEDLLSAYLAKQLLSATQQANHKTKT